MRGTRLCFTPVHELALVAVSMSVARLAAIGVHVHPRRLPCARTSFGVHVTFSMVVLAFRRSRPQPPLPVSTLVLAFRRSRPCSPLGAHVRSRLSTLTACSPSRCPRSRSSFDVRGSRPRFGFRRRSFTLHGRVHARLTTTMTASTSCERSSACTFVVTSVCSLRSSRMRSPP